MSASAPRNEIVHEAERQRQHIRIIIPASVKLGEHEARLKDLSLGGFRLLPQANIPEIKKRGRQNIRIHFDFNAFSFAIEARAEPSHSDASGLSYRFCDLNGQQSSLLRHVIKSYLSGQIVGVNDVLNIASRNNFMPALSPKASQQHGLKRIILTALPLLFVFLVTAAMLLFIAGNIYESQRFVKSHSGSADGDVFTLRASHNGLYNALISPESAHVTKGQELGNFVPEVGDPEKIISPCDCLVVQHSARSGEFKLMGEALYKFFPDDGQTYIVATIKSEDIEKLKTSARARVRISGESQFRQGRLVQILPQENEFSKLKIKLEKPLPQSLFGRPAYVEVMRF